MIALPESAQRKLRQIEAGAADEEALARGALAKIKTLNQRIADMQREARVDPKRSDEIAASIKTVEEEIEAVHETMKRRQERAANDRQLVAQVMSWLQSLPLGTVLQSVPTVEVEETVAAISHGITAAREKIAGLKRVLRGVRQQPLPRDQLRAKAEAYVAKMASLAKPTLRGAYGDGELDLVFGPDGRGPLVMACFLHPERVMERIEELFPPEGIGRERITELEGELLRLERLEEALVEKGISMGLSTVLRRPKASPLAILSVRLVTAKAKKAA